MSKCQICQNDNPFNANFCNSCGTKLVVDESKDKPTSQQDIKSPKRLAERRQLTILFCDLVGSTPLSEQLDPEDYRQLITDYHQIGKKIIDKNGGHIAQYLGDGLLVYFGYPEGLEDAPRVAVQTGLDILEAVLKANKVWEDIGKTSIKVRIGIHTGLVVVDDHLALGETVNIAARLEGLAPHNGLIISQQTLNLVQGWFEVRSLGKKILKGISKPMEVFHVLQRTGAKTRLDVAKGRGLSPLIGRDNELQLLLNHWTQAKHNKGNLVLLHGDAGIGKSRLVDTFQEQITNKTESSFLEIRCSAYQQNSAFYPLIELIEDDILKFEIGYSLEDKQAKLKSFLLQSAMNSTEAMPLLAEFLSISSSQFPPLIISPFAKRQRIIEIISKLILEVKGSVLLLLVVEDLHWADASTLEWLNSFFDQLTDNSIFILGTTRPGFQSPWTDKKLATTINLSRLSTQEIVEICLHQSKGKSLPKELLQQISAKTDGIPLFIEELTKMILESEMLTEKTDSFEMDEPLSSINIPSTLQDSLLARLDRLSDVKEIVQLASVLGYEFSLEMMIALTSQNANYLKTAIRKLLDAEIFEVQNENQQAIYQFRHALIQDAAYESLLKSRRQELHHSVAKLLEHEFVELTQNQPELLAHHYTEATQPKLAIPIWLKAGQFAIQKNATSEAISHLEKGVKLLVHIKDEDDRNTIELDYRLALGGVFVISHGFPHPKVKESFDRAMEIAQTIEIDQKLALVFLGLFGYYFNREDYKSLDELLVYVFKLAEDPKMGYWFELIGNQINSANVVKGNFEEASKSLQKVIDLFNPSMLFPWELAPSGYIEIGAKAWHMICLQIMGNMDQAKELYQNHLSFAKDHKDSMTLYHIYTFPALYSLEAKEWKNAENIIEKYLPIVKEFGDPIFSLTAEVYYNIARSFQGDKKAFVTAVKLVNICFDIGFKAFAVSMSPFIGEQYYQNGEFKSALSWIDKILTHVHETGSHVHTAELIRIKGHILKALGKPDVKVEQSFKEALALAKQQSAKTFELRATCDLAKLWQKQGKIKEAYNLLNEVYTWFEGGFDSVDLTEAKEILLELKSYKNISG